MRAAHAFIWHMFAACIVAFALALGLAICVPLAGADDKVETPRTAGSGETWTVLVYLCGSNLETGSGCATENLRELASVDLPQDVTFAIQTGGANGWRNDVVDADALQRFTMEGGELVIQDEQPRASMGSPDTFESFLEWGTGSYPADHYMLVFWDHGGGSLSGVCLDELDGDTLTLPEIRDCLEVADTRFDIVGFDTCLMATLETAQVLSPYADYLVASEEIEPAGGWAWDAWPAWFNGGDASDAVGLGASICDTYLDKCVADEVGDTVTISVIDLDKVQAITDAFDDAAEGMALATEQPVELQLLIQQGREVECFGHANYVEGYTDMVDLGDLMDCTEGSIPQAASAVSAAVDDAVVYERHGQYRSKATGISVFYPLNIDTSTFMDYYTVSRDAGLGNTAYLQYLAVRTGTYDLVNWADDGVIDLDPVGEEDARGAFACKSEIGEDGRYTVVIAGDTRWVAGATFTQSMILDDGTVVLLGKDNDLDLEIDQTTGKVTYYDRFQGGCMTIGGCFARFEIVEMVAEDDAPSYNLYSVPVELTREVSEDETKSIDTNLLVIYDYKTNSYDVLCAYEDADETGMAGKTTLALEDGDELRFRVARMVDGEVQGGSTGSITWEEGTPVEMAYAGDGQYLFMVEVEDIFGNTYIPDPAIISFEGGERSVQLAEMQ